MKQILFVVLMAVVLTTLTGFKYVTVDYTVTATDTLQSIAERFITKNTGTVTFVRGKH
jgi:hypothetical protein